MNPKDPSFPSPDEDSTVQRLLRVRPAAARAEFRQKLREMGPPAAVVVPFPMPVPSGSRPRLIRILFASAAIAALVTIGIFFYRPSSSDPIASAEPPAKVRPPAQAQQPANPVPNLPVQVREIALVRRGLEPPVQLLAVDEIQASEPKESSHTTPQVSTRIVPVVLSYY